MPITGTVDGPGQIGITRAGECFAGRTAWDETRLDREGKSKVKKF